MKLLTHLAIEPADLEPGDEWQGPSNCWKIVLFEKGFAYWIASGDTRELHAGDVIVIAPCSRGVIRCSRIGHARLRYFCFSPEHLVGFMSLAERMSLEGVAKNARTRVIQNGQPGASEFASIAADNSEATGFVYRCRILHLISILFSEAFPAPEIPARTSPASNRFQRAIGRLSDADLLSHSSEELAEMCGCSARQFRRMFRKQFQTSLRAKQIELRLDRAQQLLVETDDKVIRIAQENGYRHIGLFNSMFRKKFGVAPGEWRRMHASKPGARVSVSNA